MHSKVQGDGRVQKKNW